MNPFNFKPYRRVAVLFLAIAILLSGCAKKIEPIYYPEPPAPPRIHLLKQFNSEGGLRDNKLVQFITGEDNTDSFSKAYGLAFHQGRLFIADSGKAHASIAIVDFETGKIDRINSGISKPINLTVDTDGTLYVCDLSENMLPGIAVYDPQHRYVRRLTLDIPNYRPASVLAVDNHLYVADIMNNQIHVLNKQTGELLNTFGQNDGLGWPAHLALSPEGNILVTETGAQSLRLFSPSGEVLSRIGKPGDRAGTFSRPKATAIDRDGNIYAVDVAFQNVQILAKDGTALMYFGQSPDNRDNLFMPAGIALSYDRTDIFQKYAAPGFTIEYIVAVSSQGGPPNFGSKISLYGFGKLAGYDYSDPQPTK